jgi:hypothetical protein
MNKPKNIHIGVLAVAALGVSQLALSQEDLCDTVGKPTEMTFEYIPSTSFDPLQEIPNKAQIIVNNGVDDDGTSFVFVSNKSSDPLSGDVFFQGSVNAGERFVASETNASSGFSSNTYIYFYDEQGGPLLQEIQYHTSCSAPIVLGAQLLSATLVGYVGVNGPALVEVPFDVKPQSCPNPLNIRARGVIPAAVLGTADLDVTTIDAASLRLEGVPPLRSAVEDVGTPFEPVIGKQEAFDCNDFGPDGLMDLTLKFAAQEVIASLGDVEDGEVRVLTLTGNLKEEFGGTPISGEDVVVILMRVSSE